MNDLSAKSCSVVFLENLARHLDSGSLSVHDTGDNVRTIAAELERLQGNQEIIGIDAGGTDRTVIVERDNNTGHLTIVEQPLPDAELQAIETEIESADTNDEGALLYNRCRTLLTYAKQQRARADELTDEEQATNIAWDALQEEVEQLRAQLTTAKDALVDVKLDWRSGYYATRICNAALKRLDGEQ